MNCSAIVVHVHVVLSHIESQRVGKIVQLLVHQLQIVVQITNLFLRLSSLHLSNLVITTTTTAQTMSLIHQFSQLGVLRSSQQGNATIGPGVVVKLVLLLLLLLAAITADIIE